MLSHGSERRCSKPSIHFSSHRIREVRIKQIFDWISLFGLLGYSNLLSIPVESQKSVGDCNVIVSGNYSLSSLNSLRKRINLLGKLMRRTLSVPNVQRVARNGTCEILRLLK